MVPPARTRHRLFGSGDTTVGVDTSFFNCLTAPTLGAAGDASRMRSEVAAGGGGAAGRGGSTAWRISAARALFSSRFPCASRPGSLNCSRAKPDASLRSIASTFAVSARASASLAFASFSDAGTLRRELAKPSCGSVDAGGA